MRLGSTIVAFCFCAASMACTSLDIPPGPDDLADGGPGRVGQDAGDQPRDDARPPDDDKPSDNGAEASGSTPPVGSSATKDAGPPAKDAAQQAASADSGISSPPTQAKDAGNPNPNPPASSPTTKPDASSGTNATDTGTAPPVTNATDAGTAPPVTNDPGTSTPPVTMMSVVPGSATKAQCSSYGKGTTCNGYYCGVTLANLVAEMPADTLCGADAASIVCKNSLSIAVTGCSRTTKSANALATTAELRPLVKQCVLRDTAYQMIPDACLSCFVEQSECDNDRCLVECLAGDSKNCDACRVKSGCHTKAIACAKLPNPF